MEPDRRMLERERVWPKVARPELGGIWCEEDQPVTAIKLWQNLSAAKRSCDGTQ